MSICEHRITEDSTEFEKEFLKIYDGNLWTALDKMKDWQPPKPLVVVPQCVADWFEKNKDDLEYEIWKYIRDFDKQQHNAFFKWFIKEDAIETLVRMKLEGYTVEKEHKFSLVNKITGEYLVLPAIEYRTINENISDNSIHVSKDKLPKWKPEMYQFTEDEITSMETGSYEQIEVEE